MMVATQVIQLERHVGLEERGGPRTYKKSRGPRTYKLHRRFTEARSHYYFDSNS
jgi:hypothetical protein